MFVGHFQAVVCQLSLSSRPWFPVGELRGLLGMPKGEAQDPPESGLPRVLGSGPEWWRGGAPNCCSGRVSFPIHDHLVWVSLFCHTMSRQAQTASGDPEGV